MKKILIALIAVLSLGNLVAQETTSNVRGTVTDGAGNAVANAVVTVTSSTTGVSKSDSTDVNGLYSIRNLPSGVTYQVVVTADGLLSSESDGLNLAVGQTAVLNIALSTLEEVTVLGQRVEVASTALGPNAVFNLEDLQTSPAVNRNINDVIGQDPRVFIEQNRGDIDAIQCVGANSRFNSLTVDGIRLNDGFGLNSNGYPTQRMPFHYDAVSSVAVEMAPMSVTYGGFSACNINAVTKSGSNEMFGSGFLELGGSDLQGSSIEGRDLNLAAYDESVFGFEFGGALIQDKLFFYGAYEFYDTVNFTGRGPVGSGALREVDITQAELDRIIDIAVNKYGFNPGEIPQDPFDTEDEPPRGDILEMGYEFDSGEIAAIADYIQEFGDPDPWVEKVATYVAIREEVTAAEILSNALDLDPRQQSRRESRRVVDVLQSMGWRRLVTTRKDPVTGKAKSVRLWQRPKDDPLTEDHILNDF